jgi:hypothetical protein
MSACANRTTDHTARPVVPGEPGHRTTNQRETVWVSSQAEAQERPTVMSRPRRPVDAPTRRHPHTLHAGRGLSTRIHDTMYRGHLAEGLAPWFAQILEHAGG